MIGSVNLIIFILMRNHSKDGQAIISLLGNIYLDIVEIEQRYKLFAGCGDIRPRIDFFHDAVRAFTAGDIDDKRLNVELLSYDLRCLRYIQQMPLSPFREGGETLSPAQDIMTTQGDLMAADSRPDRKIKSQISDLYQNYAVLFAALLKPAADHDYKERIDELNNEVHDIQTIIQQFENKNIDTTTLARLAQQLEQAELRIILIKFMQEGKHKNKDDIKKLLGHLKNIIKQKDKAIKTIEDAHLRFASSQLLVFEEAKDMLKKFAVQGMNLVGKFVENSIADTKRQMGR